MAAHAAPLTIDRSAGERIAPGLLDALLRDPGTRALVVRGDAAPVADGGLLLVPTAAVAEGARWAFLGRDRAGAAVVVAAFAADVEPFAAPGPDAAPEWAALRQIGAHLADGELEALVAAIAIGRWLVDAPFCPACGGATTSMQAGWSRVCDVCGREHFPRTDPAVIVAVASEDGSRLLLGANAAWQGRMYSCFAGFVEAGESLETAVHREIAEEAGVRVADIRYVGSQPWPYPRSLMLGFHAATVADDEARADGEEILAVRWFSRDEIGEGLAGRGEVSLPGPASIAHRLIRSWYEGA